MFPYRDIVILIFYCRGNDGSFLGQNVQLFMLVTIFTIYKANAGWFVNIARNYMDKFRKLKLNEFRKK